MNPSIAIVGMACVFPDANSPGELWENVLAQRRAFRRLPADRFRREDYFSTDPAAPDRTYATEGAVIEGYEFDRVAFRVAGSTFRSADLAHWLALDVAARALADAHFPEGHGLPGETTGVLLGNTLTGEFSRSNSLRFRWPYVRSVLDTALAKENWPLDRRQKFLVGLESEYKAPFPPVGEETLAGGLSNTIAGRICNQFNFKGGGYTVDGACASSLLAVANACTALAADDLDVALAGGVDLSLDPFEIVGFAKSGALAANEMRVFDRRSAGFWPGEGCGVVVLMRHQDALAQGRRVYAVIRGWGISSDGSGGLTRPESDGQLEALRRAYHRAGFGIETVSYCEGHGTGTAVGDAAELEVLGRARHESGSRSPLAAIGSVKANIGHTKAAAGIAGLIKATMAVHMQVLPPTTGCEQPHEHFTGPAPALRVLRESELWPQDRPLRASVSAMGFGGINAHLVLESVAGERRAALSTRERSLSRSAQDAELFLFGAGTPEELTSQLRKISTIATRLSRSELTDLAAQLQQTLGPGKFRAAVVASGPAELEEKLRRLEFRAQSELDPRLEIADGIFFGSSEARPRIVFLFPGQGSPMHFDGGVWRRRFDSVRELYIRAELAAGGDTVSTRIMQPAVVTASLAGLAVLEEFGIFANAAIGHSLGEITALHWAGALDRETLLRIVKVRGEAMAELGSAIGAMLAVAAPWQEVQERLNHEPLTVVGFNSPRQTVIAGEAEAVSRFAQRAAALGLHTNRLPVSHAFHTPLVAAAVPVLAEQLARETFSGLKHTVISTVTGRLLDDSEDLRALLCRQVTSPVRFSGAFEALGNAADLLIEVGPGSVLSALVGDMTDAPVVSLDAGGNSLTGLLQALGAAFALGAPVKTAALFADRFTRPFPLDWKPKFFINPCELAPVLQEGRVELLTEEPVQPNGETKLATEFTDACRDVAAPIELIRQLVAARTELPATAIHDDHRMLSNLHLNSITVGQLVSEAARRLGLPRLVGLTDFANATVAEIARALEELKQTGVVSRRTDHSRPPAGIETWVRAFATEWIETPRPRQPFEAENSESPDSRNGLSNWRIFASGNHPLAAPLREALAHSGVNGVVVCLPENPGEEHVGLLLNAAHEVLAMNGPSHFVVVQHGRGGGGFARTLHLENPAIAACVVNVPVAHPQAVEWIVSETRVVRGFAEVKYDADGRRLEPRLKLAENRSGKLKTHSSVGPDDVLLVTGGGKGIAAECAMALARETGVQLALVGRSDPATDKELADNLARIGAAGVRCRYLRADLVDAEAARSVVAEAEQQLGPVTAVLHGAGVNTPQLIGTLDEATFRRTIAPKFSGLKNVLAAADAGKLRLLVTFSSIIGRTGLPGEADYATANEWLTGLTTDFHIRHPGCRCLALEWSVWSGAGMGERLGRIESLVQHGVTPITVDEGVRIFCELVRFPADSVALVVTGRFGEPPTLKLAETELPLHRFLERKRVFYPGVELVVETELSPKTDPYLDDHAVQKQRLFPAVLGLEAMAQAAMALANSKDPPAFENVEFLRPVAVPDHTPLRIRLVALRRDSGDVDVCLRSDETDFQVDHFRAICRFAAGKSVGVPRLVLSPFESHNLPLDPRVDLYGRILFHRGRFCRLRGYRLLRAKECVAEITSGGGMPWFGPYLPAQFVLGDPAIYDAALHAIQPCIPHWRILPIAIERLRIRQGEASAYIVRARERLRAGDDFIYDVEVTDVSGELVMLADGLRLRAVEMLSSPEVWPEALLAPYLERRLEELAGDARVSITLERNVNDDRLANGDAAIRKVLSKTGHIWRRLDGKPVFPGGKNISAAHAEDFTLATASEAGVACDLEIVTARAETAWRDLLGEDGFTLANRIARERGEDADTAATRLWCARECLKKIGLSTTAPLVLESATEDGWVLLRTGVLTVATCAVTVRAKSALVVAVAIQRARQAAIAEMVA